MKFMKELLESKTLIEKKIGHKIDYTRRDFLAHGLFGFSAYIALPSIPALVARSAFAAGEERLNGFGLPFMCFDMAGGAALAGNFLVGKAGGPDDWLRSYDTLGWNPRGNGEVDRRFGLPMAAKKSGLFQGLIATMSPEAQARFRMGSVCHFSPLDTSDAKQNTAALVAASGTGGSLIRLGLATRTSSSGGYSDSALLGAKMTPIFFNNVSDLVSLASFGGSPLYGASEEALRLMATASRSLTAEQIERVQTGPGSRMLKDRVRSFLSEPFDVTGVRLDPRSNAAAAAVYGLTPSSSPSSVPVIQATLATNVIDGVVGPSVWTLGGCDYHDGTSTTGDALDRQMGEAIGRAVEYAHRVGRPFFFQLVSDGSCSAPSGSREWRSDTNEGMQIFGYYRPEGAPEFMKENMQIGHFTDAQGAARSTVVGSDPNKAAFAVFANYCHVQGNLDKFREMSRTFSESELQSVLVFAPPA